MRYANSRPLGLQVLRTNRRSPVPAAPPLQFGYNRQLGPEPETYVEFEDPHRARLFVLHFGLLVARFPHSPSGRRPDFFLGFFQNATEILATPRNNFEPGLLVSRI